MRPTNFFPKGIRKTSIRDERSGLRCKALNPEIALLRLPAGRGRLANESHSGEPGNLHKPITSQNNIVQILRSALDDLVTISFPTHVIPAKAGIWGYLNALSFFHDLDSRLRGNDLNTKSIREERSGLRLKNINPEIASHSLANGLSKSPTNVIPAKAGIWGYLKASFLVHNRDSRLRGNDHSRTLWKLKAVYAFLFLLSFSPNIHAQTAVAPSGSGTEGDPYQIASLENLYWLSQNSSEWNGHFLQTADIDASETSSWDDGDGGNPEGFSPIGRSDTSFTGSYDGDSHTINGLFIKRSSHTNTGLFGYVSNATLANTGLVQVDITGNTRVGALGGFVSSSTLSGNYSTGSVSGQSAVGGLVGSFASGSFSFNYSHATITASTGSAGGLVGDADGTGGSISQSFATGSVTGKNSIGGLVGYSNNFEIYDCYATGNVDDGKSDANVGGLVGVSEETDITDSYATGRAIGSRNDGGLIGRNIDGTTTRSYWDTESSGDADGIGSDNNNQTVTGLTSAEMLQKSSFSDFDFSGTWGIFNGFTEPFLLAFPPESVNGLPYEEYLPSGSGTEGDPYQVTSLENLYWLSQVEEAWDAHFLQTADIDASETSSWDDGDGGDPEGFSPIGNSGTYFTGSYDGDSYTITGLFINRGSTSNVGLFGYASSVTLTNIGLVQVNIAGHNNTGGLAGRVTSGSTTITGSYTTGSVSGNSQVGGLIGRLNSGSLNESYSRASVTASDENAGGLIGRSATVITHSYATGDVSGMALSGGLIGYSSGNVLYSYATGDISGTYDIGGLIGESNGNISHSYAAGNVTGNGRLGGLTGRLDGSISHSYAVGNVTGNNILGGLVGEFVSGILGHSEAHIVDSYWNTETSGLETGVGSNLFSTVMITGLTSAEMKQKSSFTGFDFSGTWGIFNGFTEPFLQAFPPDSVNGVPYGEYFPSGSGTEGDPYLVASLEHLYWLSQSDTVWNAHFRQTANIDASETSSWDDGDGGDPEGFLPIGSSDTPFTGTYDGDGYTITGLFINRYGQFSTTSGINHSIGLFGNTSSVTLTNIGLVEVNITKYNDDIDGYVGGLAGYVGSGSITGNYTTGNIYGALGDAGGLIGYAEADTIRDNYSEADIISPIGDRAAGGLIAENSSQVVTNSYATGNVSGAVSGGLIGEHYGLLLTDSYATGNVTGSGSTGGLLGTSTGSVSRSYAAGEVSGNAFYIGGLIGELQDGTVSNSFAAGSVNGEYVVGGLAGLSYGTITNSYATGSVSGGSDMGGLVGEHDGTITGGYWNTETTGQQNGVGSGSSSGETGLSSAEMKRQSSFPEFDFSGTWCIFNGFTEPFLQAFPPDSVNGVPYEEYLPSGSGTEGDPYLVASLENLYWLSQSDTVWNARFLQTADIDASETSSWDDGKGFSPIGNSGTQFTGNYAGNDHTITGLFINRGSSDRVGLFGNTLFASLTNIGLVDVDITGNEYVGGLGGYVHSDTSIVTGNYTTGKVSGSSGVGGLIGRLISGDLSENYSKASVTASGDYAGGLIGQSSGVITFSYTTGTVTGDSEAGGLIGLSEGDVSYSFATGEVAGNSDVGGLIGWTDGSVINSYAAGSVSGNSNLGGLAGYNSGSITGSYWDTETSGQESGIADGDTTQAVTGLTSAQMKQQSSFSGFDFSGTWGIFNGFTEPFLLALAPDSVAGVPTAYFPSGSGTESDPYQVASLENLYWLSQVEEAWDAHFLQTADIDASETSSWNDGGGGDPEGFLPIGNYDTHFTGSYNGDGYTITGLYINRGSTDYIGLFGYASSVTLTNIGLVQTDVTGHNYIGGLAGYITSASTTITGSSTTGSVSGNSAVGGLIGRLHAGSLSESYSRASITASDESAGGLIGRSETAITHSYATGDVRGSAFTGGLIGESNGDISYSYATGNVSSINFFTGGFIGFSDGEVSYSYATGDVRGIRYTGGFIGSLEGEVSYSYATGDVTGLDIIGGLAGEVVRKSIITNSFAMGSVSGDNTDVGGLLGNNYNGTIAGSYWNTETSGQTTGIGFDNNNQTVTGLTTAQMIDSASFSGWDFSDSGFWNIDDGFTFPYLPNTGDHRVIVATIEGDEGWRMIGNPGDVTYGELFDPVFTQGYKGSDAGTGFSSNVYFYEESTQSWTAPSSAGDYFGSTNSTIENTALNGILLYVYADDDADGTDDAWPKYLVAENSNLNESFDVSLGYTDIVSADSAGWNMVSNPYPVSLDFTDMVSAGDITNAFEVAYVWDHSLDDGNGSYRIIFGYPLPPGIDQDYFTNDPIPAMQAFWVKATASGALLGFKPDYQGSSQKLYKSNPDNKQVDVPWLSLSIQNGDLSDRVLLFGGDKDAPNFDVPKLSTIASRYVELAVKNEETEWAVLSLTDQDQSLPLSIASTESGEFMLSWEADAAFPDHYEVILVDKANGIYQPLRPGVSHTFEIAKENIPNLSLKVVSKNVVGNEPDSDLPTVVALDQNYPNPFNPSTVIGYQLPERAKVELVVFDILGRLVATLVDKQIEAGFHQVTFNAHDLASGMYIYRLKAGDNVLTKKFTLIK